MKTKAAVLVESESYLEILDLEIPPLKQGQVLVEIYYSGVCHTQLSEVMGLRGYDPYIPHCLGHEASGTVLEIGPGVTKVRPDDIVFLSWIKGQGIDVPNTIYSCNGVFINSGAVSTFSQYAVISENRLTPLLNNIPLKEAALLGCPIPTGMGAVLNTINPKPEQGIVIFGAGGVGCCAIAAASFAGCSPIIAVDIDKEKLILADKFGATHIVLSEIDQSMDHVINNILNVTGIHLDFAVESSGSIKAMEQAFSCVKPQGGIAVIIGNAKHGSKLEIDPKHLNQGKQLRGTWGGDNIPERDFPRYQKMLLSGKLKANLLVSKTYELEEVNKALEDLRDGVTIRPILEM